MVDSGSPVNMLRRDDLTQTERECIGQAENPLNLSTANGPIEANEEMTFELKDLKIKDEAMILDHAPPGICVLSMGRAVEEHDCAVWWTKKHVFLFMNPDGEWRKVTISKYVPCLTATDIENLDNYISGYCAESLPHDVSLVEMVEKLPKFVIEAIYHSLEQKCARSPSDAAGNTAQKVASRTQAGGAPQADDKKPTATKFGGVTIKPKYFAEVFAGKAGLSKAAVKFGNVEIYTVEIDDKDGRDILNKAVKKHILGLIKNVETT